MLNVPDIQTDHKVHESLKFDTMDDRFYGVERQYNKTFEWLFENETLDFPDWLRSGRKIFWITGKAGSGKSTLMKYAFSDPRTLRMLEENGGNGDRPFLAQFFFHGRGTTLQKSFKGLLQSVLYEILNHYPDLIPHILPNHVGKEWRLETLKASFLKLFTKQFNRSLKVCLFIDGLDEFEGDHDEIADFFLAGIEQSVHRIQLCVSSRPLPVFLHHFRTCPRIEMHEQTRYDIRCYVTERLDETVQMRILRQLHQFEVEDFISDLIDKGSGVFLWARLAVKSLIKGLNNGENIKELRSRLRQLPSELGDLFQTMLDSIDPSGGREAAEILQLVSIAENQSSLFLIYLALGYPASVLDRSDTEFELQQVEALRTTASLLLQSRCAGLVEVVKYDGSGTALCVQFLHQSVKDFVNQADTWASLKARSRPQFSPSRALLAAVVRCVQCELVSGYHIVYESSMVAHFGHYARFAEIETGQAQTCMLQELIRLCNIHYRKANGKSCDDIDEGIPADLNFIKEAPEWIDELFRNVAIKFIRPSLIFYAVWYDIPLTIRLTMEAYLESTDEVSEIMDKLLYFRTLGLFSYEYPDQGHEPLQTLRFLIQHGANPNADVLEIGKSTWRSFLHGLCCEFPPGPPGPSRGCNATELLRVIELFIHSGADIHAWIPCAGNCLGFWVRQPCIENPSQTKFPVSASAVVREFSSYMGRSEKAKLQQILDGMAQRGAEEIFAYEPVP